MLQVHDLESLRCDQEESLESFRSREKAFSERFRGLFRQYCGQLRVCSPTSFTGGAQKMHKLAGAEDAEMLERLQMYEDEELRGDVVRLMQIFPMLLEDLVSISSSSSASSHEFKFDEAIKPLVRLNALVSAGGAKGEHLWVNQTNLFVVEQKSGFEPPSHFLTDPVKRAAGSRQVAVSFKMDAHPKSSKVRPQRPPEPRLPPRSAQSSAFETENAGDGIRESLSTQRPIAVHTAPPPPSAGRRTRDGRLWQAARESPSIADDACFREQLELIRDAFQSFKQPPQRATERSSTNDQ